MNYNKKCVLCNSENLLSQVIDSVTVLTCKDCQMQFLKQVENEKEFYVDYSENKHNVNEGMNELRQKQSEQLTF